MTREPFFRIPAKAKHDALRRVRLRLRDLSDIGPVPVRQDYDPLTMQCAETIARHVRARLQPLRDRLQTLTIRVRT